MKIETRTAGILVFVSGVVMLFFDETRPVGAISVGFGLGMM